MLQEALLAHQDHPHETVSGAQTGENPTRQTNKVLIIFTHKISFNKILKKKKKNLLRDIVWTCESENMCWINVLYSSTEACIIGYSCKTQWHYYLCSELDHTQWWWKTPKNVLVRFSFSTPCIAFPLGRCLIAYNNNVINTTTRPEEYLVFVLCSIICKLKNLCLKNKKNKTALNFPPL